MGIYGLYLGRNCAAYPACRRKVPSSCGICLGSYARGEAREDSDVDLVIDDTDSGLRGFAYGGLYGDLRDALEKDIDMVPVSGLDLPAQHKSDADFREAVQKERREIYAVA